ncbi:MAG: hypothetical protein DGJ47_000187 [Rickettsiaceae bacterium]
MINTLLFIHLVLAILLITAILLQKTSTDGLSGIGGGSGGGMGIVSSNTAASFLSRTTVVLAVLFFVNAIILANLSTKTHTSVDKKIEKVTKEEDNTALPIAK